MANESAGMLGYKVGMTQLYTDDGAVAGVTVIDVTGNTVLATRSEDGADGYNAVQLGIGTRKANRTSKPMQGNFDKAGVSPKQHVREVRRGKDDVGGYEVGSEIAASDVFGEGDFVDVTGTSKGRGFAGVMKKYNFRGFIRSHGTHEYFRHGGSIGTRLTPGHVLKGKKMPGQMGNVRSTVQNMKLVKVDAEKGLLYIKGGVPGPNGGLVLVRKAVKKG